MSRYLGRYIRGFRRLKKTPPENSLIGQCSYCLDIFTVYYTEVEGFEPLLSTYTERKDGRLEHKCGGLITLWKMNTHTYV